MAVFGRLNLNIHQNPESIDPALQDDLVDVAQSAFTAEGFPTEEDVKQHILPSDSVIVAEVEGEAVGFASTDYLSEEGIVYAAGISVDPEYQGNGFGKLMRTRGVLEMVEGEQTVATRTQNPAVLGYMQELFDAYPLPGEEIPEGIAEDLEELAHVLDPDADYDQPVMRGAYGGPANSELPETDPELREYVEETLNLQNGDAMLSGGKTTDNALQKTYDEMVQTADYEIHEKVV